MEQPQGRPFYDWDPLFEIPVAFETLSALLWQAIGSLDPDPQRAVILAERQPPGMVRYVFHHDRLGKELGELVLLHQGEHASGLRAVAPRRRRVVADPAAPQSEQDRLRIRARELTRRLQTERIQHWSALVSDVLCFLEEQLEQLDARAERERKHARGGDDPGAPLRQALAAIEKLSEQLAAHDQIAQRLQRGEVPKQPTKRRRGPNDKTKVDLKELYNLREQALAKGEAIPPFTNACELAGTTYDTAKKWIPEQLRERWSERKHWSYSEFSELFESSEFRNDDA